jgi:aspartyl-tRNA(Asn)/glutamyl-tRNA(Gln) amidotransferase subunit A
MTASAAEIAAAFAAGRLSAADSVEAALARLEAAAPLRAVTALHAARARRRAAALDRDRAEGRAAGPLAAVPFAVKNLYDVAGTVTRAGSAATSGTRPASADAFAIRALEAAGAILVASANMDEFAYGFSGENIHDGDTRNPRGPWRGEGGLSAGGSSSGSAALVAAGAVPLALGTDTNGSIRVPAALSGVAGLKPTYGRLSRSGVFPFVDSLDHVGLFAGDVRDLALGYDALQGRDPADPAQVPQPQSPAAWGPGPIRSAARLGGWFATPLHDDVAAAMDAAAEALGCAATVDLALAEAARAAAFVLTTAEGGQKHLPGLRARPGLYGPLVRDRLRAGALVPAAWVGDAQRLRRRLSEDLAALHARHPILLAPATPCPAFPLGAAEWEVAGVSLPIRLAIGMFTQPLTLAGVPIAVVARMGATSGLPVGVQVIGRPWHEGEVLAAAQRLEAAGFRILPQTDEAQP